MDTAVGSVSADQLGELLESAACHSVSGQTGGTAHLLTIKTGQVMVIGPATGAAAPACMTIVDVVGLTSLEAAIRAVRALLTSHTPTLGKSPEDSFDDYIAPPRRGGPFTLIGAVCQSGDQIRVALVPTPTQISLKLDPEQFLAPARSRYVVQPIFGVALPAGANRIRAIKIVSGCATDSEFAENTFATLRSLGGPQT